MEEDEVPLSAFSGRGMWGQLKRAVRDHHPTCTMPPESPTFHPMSPAFWAKPLREDFPGEAYYQEAKAAWKLRTSEGSQGDATGAREAGGARAGAQARSMSMRARGTVAQNTEAGRTVAIRAGAEPASAREVRASIAGVRGVDGEDRGDFLVLVNDQPLIVIHLEDRMDDPSTLVVPAAESGLGEDDLPPPLSPAPDITLAAEGGLGEDDLPPHISLSDTNIPPADLDIMTGILASPFFTADTDVTAAVSEAAVWSEGNAGPPTLVVGMEEDRVEASEEEVETGFYMDNLEPVSDVE